MTAAWRRSAEKPWLLERKSLPAFIDAEPERIVEFDLKLAAFHFSRYVSMTGENARR